VDPLSSKVFDVASHNIATIDVVTIYIHTYNIYPYVQKPICPSVPAITFSVSAHNNECQLTLC